jgi:large subunit ribosomal protein L25
MERVALDAKRRDGLGTNHVRRLRRNGLIPGIVYGRGRAPVPVVVDGKALRTALHTPAGMNVLIDLTIANGDRGSATVMVKDLQRDIFRRDITHVDFFAIDLAHTVEARVPISFLGQAAGIADGGVFEVHLREIVVECLPTQIPKQIQVDISALGVGDSIHVRDLAVPSDVTIATPPEEVVATVVMPKVIEEAAPAAAPEAAVAAEVPVAVEAKPGEAKPATSAERPEKPDKAEKAKPAAAAERPEKPDKTEKAKPSAGSKAE